MTRRGPLLLLVLASALLSASSAQAQLTPTMKPGENGMDTSFARIEMDPRPPYAGPGSPVVARILIKNTSGVRDAAILMFGFNGLSDAVDIQLRGVGLNGSPLPVDKDERAASRQQPKVWIKPANVSAGKEITMEGTVTAHGNGQFHVGAIVIAFDETYQKFVTPQQEYAEVYAFGLLRATGVDEGEGRPPFQGQGNVSGPAWALAVLCIVLVAALRRP
jgi:hypothetical protein